MNTQNQPKFFDKRMLFLTMLQIGSTLILAMIFSFVYLRSFSSAPGRGMSMGMGNGLGQRELGIKLQSVGVISEALKAYEQAFAENQVPEEMSAQLAYTMAELYEKEGQFEKALKWYYAIGSLDAKSPLNKDAANKVVGILERLQKYSAAKYALQNSTELTGDGEGKDGDGEKGGKGGRAKQGGTIVAKVGEQNIYLHDIDLAFDHLPRHVKEKLQTADGKKEFAKKYVADIVLFQKGERQGLVNDPKIRKQLDEVRQQLVVQKILEDEVINKTVADEVDVKNFFNSNAARYQQKAQAQVRMIQVKDKNLAAEIAKDLKAKKSSFEAMVKKHSIHQESKEHEGMLETPVTADTPFLGSSLETTKILMGLKVNEIAGPQLVQGSYYIIQVEAKQNEKKYSYEEIKDSVMTDYKMSKQQKQYQELIDQTLKTQNVQLYLDKVK